MSYFDILVLTALSKGPAHGYELRRRVERFHGDGVSLNPNVVYPALHRFEAMGALDKQVHKEPGRPSRNVFSLNSHGETVRHDLLAQMTVAEAGSDLEFMTRVTYFRYLTRDERLALIDTREAAVRARIDQINGAAGIPKSTAEEPGPDDPAQLFGASFGGWPSVTRAQAVARCRSELEWAAALRAHVDADLDQGPVGG